MTPETHRKLEMLKKAAITGKLDVNQAIRWVRQEAAELPPAKLELPIYLARFSVNQLHVLKEWALRIGPGCPQLGLWIVNEIRSEILRRKSWATDSPLEAARPDATELIGWDDQTLARALIAIFGPSYAVSDPLIGEFIDKIQSVLVTLASRRLSRPEAPKP